jgi:nicotinamidase-related amidase
MAEQIWDKFLTERDKEVFAASGYGVRAGFGKKPALLVIDVNYNFCGDKNEPILESIKRYRNSCGEDAWDALPVIRTLIDACHDNTVPVIFSTGSVRADGWDRGGWDWKNSRNTEDAAPPADRASNRDGNDIMDEIAPQPHDLVIAKLKPSVFHGTNLTGFLNDMGVDSLLITGTTTSGCVRATVLDAFSLNIRTTVAADACFDRSQASHAINLCDMNAKYSDVISSDEMLTHINTLSDVEYNMPTGISMGG